MSHYYSQHATALRADLGESVGDVRDAIAQRYQDLASRAGVELDTLQERVERMSASVEADARDFVSSVRRKTAGNDNSVQS